MSSHQLDLARSLPRSSERAELSLPGSNSNTLCPSERQAATSRHYFSFLLRAGGRREQRQLADDALAGDELPVGVDARVVHIGAIRIQQ